MRQGVNSIDYSNLSFCFTLYLFALLCHRKRGSWLWHYPVNTNTAIIWLMGVILNLTTPRMFSLTLMNSDVQFILCKVYNRVHSCNITSRTWTHLQWGREGRKVAISKSPIFHVWIQNFDWLSVFQFSAQSSSLLSLQYLKFSELIWFLRRHSFEIIILL